MKVSVRERTRRFSKTIAATSLGALAALVLVPAVANAFNSGSTGADGGFNPTVDTQVQLPPSGVFNYTSVNIPAGVTVTFRRNTTNTPVVWLVQGDVTIAGTVDVSGKDATPSGAAGDGNVGDDGQPGVGGPGGFDGGRGGSPGEMGSAGLGPGGGGPPPLSAIDYRPNCPVGGGGGGFGRQGDGVTNCGVPDPEAPSSGRGGAPYGSTFLLPLIGGSGGAGGGGGVNFGGGGGGGGAGAILIAASGTISVTGRVVANGGAGAHASGAGCGAPGAGGSGGGIRIVATTMSGAGTISATGGAPGPFDFCSFARAGVGGVGRIRLEADVMQFVPATEPGFTFGAPGTVFIAGSPALLISSVAGVAAPASPTGSADIILPANTPNPVTVGFTTRGVPVGNTVTLTVTPASGPAFSVVSPALTGTTETASASVAVNLPTGPSVLAAATSFTVTAAVGDALSRFAQGERVEKVTLVAKPGAPSTALLRTRSGKTFEIAAALLPAGS